MPSLRRRKAAESQDGSMTLMEHLYELRHRLFFAVLSVLGGGVIGFIWFSVGIPALHIPTLGDILIKPYCAVPASTRVTFGDSDSCQLLATSAFSALQLRLTAGVMAGAILSCPIWLYHVWAYVGPALYSKEKKFAITFSGVGAGLFVGGMVLAYVVIPEALKVLLGFGGDVVVAGLDPEKYYKFLLGMMLIFGVSLELPLLLVMLNFAGVLKGASMAGVRRYAFFGLVLFSGFAVPGNDPISMGVLAVTLCILYECAVQVAKVHDKRKAKRLAAEESAFSEEASPLENPSTAPGATPESELHSSTASPTAAPRDSGEAGSGRTPGNDYDDVT